jgi:Uma2 family endonuclease
LPVPGATHDRQRRGNIEHRTFNIERPTSNEGKGVLVFRCIRCDGPANGRLPSPAFNAFMAAMSQSYEEIVDGASLPRSAPGDRHEKICGRLHREIAANIAGLADVQLLVPRTQVQVTHATTLRPDLALVMAATGKLFLAIEIISRDDHHADTVTKKEIYDHIRVPRLWMVDPRYDNVEIYHSFEFGLQLKGILAGREELTEKLIPKLKLTVAELFAM